MFEEVATKIDTNGAAGGCEDLCRWCQEVPGARRGWLINIAARHIVSFTRYTFRGWIGKVFSKVAPNNRYDWQWMSGVWLIKRPVARRIPWFRVNVQHTLYILPYHFLGKTLSGISLVFKVCILTKVDLLQKVVTLLST